MREILIDNFFQSIKGEWQLGYEDKYRYQLAELILLLHKDFKKTDILQSLDKKNIFVSEKFLKYMLKHEKIEGNLKKNAKKTISFISAMSITSRDYNERIEALGEGHAKKIYWEPEDEINKRRIRVIANAVGLEKGGVGIDVGCGAGTFSHRMALKGGTAIGVDYSLASLKVAYGLAKKKFKGNKLIYFVVADATCLPFQDLSAAVIVAADFIEHIDTIGKEMFLDEVARILCQSGRMIIFTPNKLRELVGAIVRLFKSEKGTRLHFGLTSRFSFEKKLRKRGFIYRRSFVDVSRPYLAKLPLLKELLALEILWVIKKK